MNVIVGGLCYTENIVTFLNTNKWFIDNYKITNFYFINKTAINSINFDGCDIFIYNKSRYSTKHKNFIEDLKNKCKVIELPTLFSNIYFPNAFHMYKPIELNNEINIQDTDFDQVFTYRDIPYFDYSILKWFLEGLTIEEVLYKYNQIEYDVDALFQEEMNILKNNYEITSDIKVSDFIEKEYKNNLLFYSINHPTNFYIMEITKRILIFLGSTDLIISNARNELDYIIHPISKYFKFNVNARFMGIYGNDNYITSIYNSYSSIDKSILEFNYNRIKERKSFIKNI